MVIPIYLFHYNYEHTRIILATISQTKTELRIYVKKVKILLVLLPSNRGNQELCLKYMPAAKNCKITFNLVSMHRSQSKGREMMNLLRMNSIHFNTLTPVPARHQLNSTNFTENISTVELVPSNGKPESLSYVNAERPILHVMVLLSASPSLFCRPRENQDENGASRI